MGCLKAAGCWSKSPLGRLSSSFSSFFSGHLKKDTPVMFTLLVMGMACLMAPTIVLGEANPEAEADPQFFYNPYPYPAAYWGYPQYQPANYYYPTQTSYQPIYHNPRVVSVATVEKKPEPEVPVVTKKHQIRPIVPVFDYLRSGNSQVVYLRPDEVGPEPEVENQKVLTYSVPYTQAYLNRVPAANFY